VIAPFDRQHGRSTVRVGYWDRRKAANALDITWLHARSMWRRARGGPFVPASAARRRRAYRKLFVVGCPRSGTTWITSILANHPQVINTAESHAYPTVLGPFTERRLRGDPGWRVVLTRYDLMADRDWNVGLHRYTDRKTLRDLIVTARARPEWSDEHAAQHVIEWVFDHFFATHGGTPERLFVEKTPAHQLYAHRILRSFPEARLVEVVRDGRDVCASMERMAGVQWWPPSDRSAQIETWVKHIRLGMAVRAEPDFAGRILQVRYEAVRAQPIAEMERLFAFADLDATRATLAGIAAATDVRRAPPSPRRGLSASGRVGSWKDHFTPEDSELFRQIAGDLHLQAGYDY
jgi:hypothetical protein